MSLKGLRGLSTDQAHCSGGPCQRPSSVLRSYPPLLNSPSILPMLRNSLKVAVRLLLDCRLPMYIAWGRQHTQLYNDAYRPILGRKYPSAMGSSVIETWPEIWSTIGPMWNEVWQGRSHGFDGFKRTIEHHGYFEDRYFNFSYSPVPDFCPAWGTQVNPDDHRG